MRPPPVRTRFRDLPPLAKVIFVVSLAAVIFGLIAVAVAFVAVILIVLGLLGHGVAAIWT
jgi:hypothetical protein